MLDEKEYDPNVSCLVDQLNRLEKAARYKKNSCFTKAFLSYIDKVGRYISVFSFRDKHVVLLRWCINRCISLWIYGRDHQDIKATAYETISNLAKYNGLLTPFDIIYSHRKYILPNFIVRFLVHSNVFVSFVEELLCGLVSG